LLLTAQAQAFLPTPAALVMTGELALDANETMDSSLGTKSQNAEPILTAYTKPIIAKANAESKDRKSTRLNSSHDSISYAVSYLHAPDPSLPHSLPTRRSSDLCY